MDNTNNTQFADRMKNMWSEPEATPTKTIDPNWVYGVKFCKTPEAVAQFAAVVFGKIAEGKAMNPNRCAAMMAQAMRVAFPGGQ